DVIMLISDGKNSFVKKLPAPGQVHIYCINTSRYPDMPHLKEIIGQSGGRYINLAVLSTAESLEAAGKAENILLGLSVPGKKMEIDQKLSDLDGDTLLLTGMIPGEENSITLSYGNNGKVQAAEKIEITGNELCQESAIERIGMLSVFDSYAKNNSYWMDVLSFGKQEKVVTLSTAFIVLEKAEDYIKFKIQPPEELESECDMNIFVKANEEKREQYKKLNEMDVLATVAEAYNERLLWWDKNKSMISLTEEKAAETVLPGKPVKEVAPLHPGKNSSPVTGELLAGNDKIVMGTEVIVTAMGQARQPKELGFSVSVIRNEELTQSRAVNFQNGLTGKVSGLNVTGINSGVFGDTRITLRGIRSLTGNNQPMLVVDGMPVDLRFINTLNPNTIREVTILKSPAATAVYGPDGANGALIVQTKKGSRGRYSYYWGTYRLKDREDMDYLADIKAVAYGDKISKYHELKKMHGDEAGYYFDVAQHLFEVGYHKDALTVLFSAADITGGDRQVLKAIGYTLEGWKRFDEAILVYMELVSSADNDLYAWRDLALTYHQLGDHQEAVNIYYEGITKNHENYEFAQREIKSMMLQEMNAIIAIHSDILDLSGINKHIIRPLTMDLRVTINCNTRDLSNDLSVVEPDGKICTYNKPQSGNGGRLTSFNYNYGYKNYPQEYQVVTANSGKYKLRLNYVDYGSYYNALKIPTIVKITTFRNFGKIDQTLEVENVIMDNQHGNVEIAELKW
ncbi:MAG: TonB-dependent receptor plug domain-containing protein, partial [Ferruginibacter sp.]|nr:TonB-dependent receptor plug domain-containing protein [Chitinophagaceae bacterium]